jgi:hypothetical protein
MMWAPTLLPAWISPSTGGIVIMDGHCPSCSGSFRLDHGRLVEHGRGACNQPCPGSGQVAAQAVVAVATAPRRLTPAQKRHRVEVGLCRKAILAVAGPQRTTKQDGAADCPICHEVRRLLWRRYRSGRLRWQCQTDGCVSYEE